MAKAKKKSVQKKKVVKTKGKPKKSKIVLDPKTDSTGISDGTMKDAFRDAFLRREI